MASGTIEKTLKTAYDGNIIELPYFLYAQISDSVYNNLSASTEPTITEPTITDEDLLRKAEDLVSLLNEARQENQFTPSTFPQFGIDSSLILGNERIGMPNMAEEINNSISGGEAVSENEILDRILVQTGLVLPSDFISRFKSEFAEYFATESATTHTDTKEHITYYDVPVKMDCLSLGNVNSFNGSFSEMTDENTGEIIMQELIFNFEQDHYRYVSGFAMFDNGPTYLHLQKVPLMW